MQPTFKTGRRLYNMNRLSWWAADCPSGSAGSLKLGLKCINLNLWRDGSSFKQAAFR